MTTELVKALKDRQERDRLTQEEFAALLGLSQGTLSRLYSGSRKLGMDTFQKIVSVYPELAFLFLAHDIPAEKGISPQESPQPPADAP